MPRVQDTSKVIPFRYSKNQIRYEIPTNRYYIVTYNESLEVDRYAYLLYEDGTVQAFNPFLGVDLPENKLVETSLDLYGAYEKLLDCSMNHTALENKYVEIRSRPFIHGYLCFNITDTTCDILRADGKMILNEQLTNIKKDRVIAKYNSFTDAVFSKEFYNQFAYLGLFSNKDD